MNSSLASPAVQLAKAHSERNEVVRIDSEINSHLPDQLSTGGTGVWPLVQQFGVTLDGGKEKGPNSKLTKARQSKGSNHPPQGVPQRRYMVVDGLGVARAQAILEERIPGKGSSSSSPQTGCLVICESTGLVCVCVLYL